MKYEYCILSLLSVFSAGGSPNLCLNLIIIEVLDTYHDKHSEYIQVMLINEYFWKISKKVKLKNPVIAWHRLALSVTKLYKSEHCVEKKTIGVSIKLHQIVKCYCDVPWENSQLLVTAGNVILKAGNADSYHLN